MFNDSAFFERTLRGRCREKKESETISLKVSACRGNFSGASASHSTAIAAQQHGVATASQHLPIVSWHNSCKTITLVEDRVAEYFHGATDATLQLGVQAHLAHTEGL